MTCSKFKEWLEDLEKDPKKLHSRKEVMDMLVHSAMCKDCGEAYDDYYYSSKNLNYERYMKENSGYKKEVEKRAILAGSRIRS